MKSAASIAIAALLAAAPGYGSEIQKCANRDGGITYQDAPCASGKTLATLPRAPAYADPAALRQAEYDRLKLQRALEFRARLALLDASREAVARGSAAPRYEAGPLFESGPYEGPYYSALPVYASPQFGGITPRASAAPPVSSALPPPGILDSPAPCRTLQCQQQRAAQQGQPPQRPHDFRR